MKFNKVIPMQSTSQHTPTPWKYHLGRGANPRFHIQAEGGYQIASTTEHSQLREVNAMREANVAFIVRAVNSHETLLAAVACALGYIPVETALYEKLLLAWKSATAKAEGR